MLGLDGDLEGIRLVRRGLVDGRVGTVADYGWQPMILPVALIFFWNCRLCFDQSALITYKDVLVV